MKQFKNLVFAILLSSHTIVRAQSNSPPPSLKPGQRFDDLVRDDFFSRDPEKLARAMRLCEDFLAKDSNNAPALVWHGAGLVGQSSQPFQTGDIAKGMDLWDRGLKEMNDAVALQPESVQVRIPRGATLLSVAKYTPIPEVRRQLLQLGVADYEKTLELQNYYFKTLGSHQRGELLFGLANGWYQLGETNKCRQYLHRIADELTNTVYATRAREWLAADPESLAAKSKSLSCVGCHDR